MNRTALLLLILIVPAVAAEPDDVADPGERLRGLVTAGRWAELLASADELIEREPESVVGWRYRAYALHRLGRLDDAGEAYEKTVGLDPENGWAYLNLAELRAEQSRRKDVVKAAERAVALDPKSTDVRTRISRIHREAGEYEVALAGAITALGAGVDPGWCHAEMGYLYWVLGDADRSREHWVSARKADAPREACRHGFRLVEWDRPRGSAREQAEVRRRRLGFGEAWTFTVDGVEVVTRVGPRLPKEIERTIAALKSGHARALGVSGDEEWAVHLHLSRTLEEHERHREREFPAGYSGKAFVVPRWTRGRGRWGVRGRGGSRRHELDVYLAWSEPGLERSLAHELAHAMVRLRIPRASWPPVWLDEGIATHLELTPDERGRREAGRVRHDLIAVIDRAAREGKLVPTQRLLAAQRPSFTGSDARLHYAQSWALVHWLTEGQKSNGGRRWKEFLDRWNAPGRPAPGAFLTEVYGRSVEEIDKAVAAHLTRIR